MGISDRGKEVKRRRHRRKKLAKLAKKLKTAKASERTVISENVRQLTPGAAEIFQNWGLTED